MAGNWKMNLNHVEATGVVQKLAWSLADFHYEKEKSEAAVIVPFTDIRTVQNLIEGDKLPITFGAQDVSVH
jgi:triosephosphate isomerase